MKRPAVTVNSVDELRAAIRELRSGPQASVRIGCLFEAPEMNRMLEKKAPGMEVSFWGDRAGQIIASTVREAAEHYIALDLLDLFLDLMRLDLEAGIPLTKDRVREVRKSAFAVVSTAHVSSRPAIMVGVTMEAQRIARVVVGLGFCAPDVEAAAMAEDDMMWLGVGGEGAAAAWIGGGHGPLQLEDDVAGLADQVGSLQIAAGNVNQQHGARAVQSGRQEGAVTSQACDASQVEGVMGLGDTVTVQGEVAVAIGLGDADQSLKNAALRAKIVELQGILAKAKNAPYGEDEITKCIGADLCH